MKSELITNRARAKQILAFDDMVYGRCRPSDVDCSIDFQGETFAFVELKGAGVGLTLGQKLHLEGLVKGLTAGGKVAYAVLANHDTPDTEHDVRVSAAQVAKVFDGRMWIGYDGITVDELLNEIHEAHLERHSK